MSDYAIKIVDAFTTTPFMGNPCGVATRADGLDDLQMQRIARELNLSETAFVFPSSVADFRVRFFTPRQEIPLAGHPTIATWHALVEDGLIARAIGRRHYRQELAAGVLPVDVDHDGDGVRVLMTQAPPEFGATLDREAMAEALGVAASDLVPGLQPQVVSTGTKQAMVLVRSLEVLRRLRPQAGRLEAIDNVGGHVGTHVFALESMGAACATHARHFAPALGIMEDPVTGSASGGMAAYLWRYGLLRHAAFRAEQGHLIGRAGIVEIEVESEGNVPAIVRVGGRAVTVLRGTISV